MPDAFVSEPGTTAKQKSQSSSLIMYVTKMSCFLSGAFVKDILDEVI